MSEEQEPWVQQPGESLVWYKRFTRYRLMGPVHSIPGVWREEESTKNPDNPRPEPPGDWYKAAKQWKWEERTVAWDAHLDEQIEKQIAAERKRVLRSQYALMHKRIEALNKLAEKLEGYMQDEQNIWLPDVKGIGTGPTAERVDLVRFNDALISEYRATFADIAAEKGERVKKQELTGADGNPLGIGGQVGFYPVQLPEKEVRPGAKVELPGKDGESEEAHASH
jgi:hypothetical protein